MEITTEYQRDRITYGGITVTSIKNSYYQSVLYSIIDCLNSPSIGRTNLDDLSRAGRYAAKKLQGFGCITICAGCGEITLSGPWKQWQFS